MHFTSLHVSNKFNKAFQCEQAIYILTVAIISITEVNGNRMHAAIQDFCDLILRHVLFFESHQTISGHKQNKQLVICKISKSKQKTLIII